MTAAPTPSAAPGDPEDLATRAADPYTVTRSEEELDTWVVVLEREVVRVRKVIVTEQVTTTVSHEELRVEREPAAGSVIQGEPDPDLGAARPLELVLRKEVLEKRVVPVERVRVSTYAVTQERRIDTMLRAERVEVQGTGRGTAGLGTVGVGDDGGGLGDAPAPDVEDGHGRRDRDRGYGPTR